MGFRSSEFLLSGVNPSSWPMKARLEIAFCGRSNVGKSSLLNELLGKKGLAKVSNTPGSTEWINFYQSTFFPSSPGLFSPLDLFIADLPGFGFAARSQAKKNIWRQLVESYFTQRSNLRVVFLLCDARRAFADAEQLLEEEKNLLDYLSGLGKTVILVMTKSDELPKHQRKIALQKLKDQFSSKAWICSIKTGEGIKELLDGLEKTLSSFK